MQVTATESQSAAQSLMKKFVDLCICKKCFGLCLMYSTSGDLYVVLVMPGCVGESCEDVRIGFCQVCKVQNRR